jgi:hypothetical protein
MVPIYLERWYLQPSRDTCLGCRYLAGVGVFHRGAGPYPPLHRHCNCRRRLIVSRGMSFAAFNVLVAEADRNGARAGRVLTRAQNLRDRG